MKLTVDSKQLATELSKIYRVCPSRTTKPELGMVRLECRDDALHLYATDLEISASSSVVAEVSAAGVALVDPEKLLAILKTSTSVVIEADDSKVQVRTETGTYTLVSGDTSALSPDERISTWSGTSVPAATLKQAFEAVRYAAAVDEGKYAMRGVRLEIDKSKLRTIATDGKRLAIHEADIECEEQFAALLPTKAIAALLPYLESETCSIGFSGSTVSFRCGHSVITTRELEGRFPPYETVLKSHKPKSTAIADSSILSAAIRNASITTDSESHAVNIEFQPSPRVVIEAQSVSVGASKVEAVLEEYSGDPVSLRVDPKYILDALKHATTPATITLESREKSFLITSGNTRCLIVPMV